MIPVKTNIENRKKLEEKLKERKVKIYTGVHSSGHGRAEDLRKFINLTKPKYLLPSQGEKFMEEALTKIAEEEGYVNGKTVIQLRDGENKNLIWKKIYYC